MRHYIYTDRSFGPKVRPTVGQVLFECDAPDILTADEMLKAATGHIAIKYPTIWCGFEEISG